LSQRSSAASRLLVVDPVLTARAAGGKSPRRPIGSGDRLLRSFAPGPLASARPRREPPPS